MCPLAGEYGPKQKPGFIFQKSYWFPPGRPNIVSASYENETVVLGNDVDDTPEDCVIEKVPADMKNKAAVRYDPEKPLTQYQASHMFNIILRQNLNTS